MPLFVWAMLPDGTISYVNRGWLEYTGLTPEQGRQREENHRFLHPEDVPRLDAAWEQARRSEEPWEVEYRLLGRDGTYRWFLGRSLAERDEDGRLTGWISTATNIDDGRRAVETLRAANTEKDMFLTMAAHELRTPLQAARSYTHLARVKAGEEMTPGVERALNGIHRSVGRMASLVENLLDVGQLQRGELRMAEPVELDMGRLLHEVAEQFQPQAEGQRLKLEVPEGLMLKGDRERLDQVFTNLISNALRYSPGGGPVVVTARREEGQVHVEVKDHGLGIPVEKLERIFERFGRAHGISYGGLGLGLTIARGIVERHGGRIWAESEGRDGEGSRFHVVLPVR
jgi:PAS domain S-box-containing protein